MKKSVLIACLSVAFVSAPSFAKNALIPQVSPYDVVIPSLPQDPVAGDRVVGQVYYNTTTSAVTAVDKNGNTITLGLGSGNSVISGGTERVERVSVTSTCTANPCTIASQSGTWVQSITWNAAGDYTVNINSGIFSSAPVCVAWAGNVVTALAERSSAATTTTAFRFFTVAVGTGAVLNSSFDVICMGPR